MLQLSLELLILWLGLFRLRLGLFIGVAWEKLRKHFWDKPCKIEKSPGRQVRRYRLRRQQVRSDTLQQSILKGRLSQEGHC